MESRRKTLGAHVKATRLIQGYSSQPAFAAAVGKSPRSISKVELGDSGAGDAVLTAVEHTLKWPIGSIEHYLTAGGPLPVATKPATPDLTLEDQDRERIERMTLEEIFAVGRQIALTSGEHAAILWLRTATAIKAEAVEQTFAQK